MNKQQPYRTLNQQIRTGVALTHRERLQARLLVQRVEARQQARQFGEVVISVIYIIGGVVDQTVNVVRALTIWSLLVLGVGAVSVVFIRAYMVGLLGVPVLFAGVGVTVTIALGVGLTVTAAAHRAAITVQRVQIPEWLGEEGA
jgi:hypothetical protein